MTALAGLFGADARARCERMVAAQAMYGSGPPRLWNGEGIALGRRLEPLLLEDRFDTGVPTAGALALAGDVRLDNRAELAGALGIDSARMSDCALLLRGWERWGEQVLDRIAGDFALALWNGAERRLLLVRDPLGARPLCFAWVAGGLAFASMPRGLHALADLPYAVDRRQLAAFLALAPNDGPATMFEGVERVLPGELVEVEEGKVERRLWWRPDLSPLRLPRPADYAEAVGEALDRAVAACLRGGEGHVAAQLSAGLDSAAVVTSAARSARVSAFTAVPHAPVEAGGRLVDEGPLAAAVAATSPAIDHELVRAAPHASLASLDRAFLLYQRPVPNLSNHGWTAATNDAVRMRGLRVMLTGQAGNLSFSHHGQELLPDLLARGRLIRLARVLARRREGAWRLLHETVSPLLPSTVWTALRRRRGRAVDRSDWSLLCSDQAETAPTVDYAQQPRRLGPTARLEALRRLDMGQFNKGTLAGWGIDLRDPTADRRLIELCLRIPADIYMQAGEPRALARRVLAGRVPDMLLAEQRRGVQGADWHAALVASRATLRAETGRFAEAAAALVDMDRVNELADSIEGGSPGDPASERLLGTALLRAVSAGHFMRKVAGSNG